MHTGHVNYRALFEEAPRKAMNSNIIELSPLPNGWDEWNKGRELKLNSEPPPPPPRRQIQAVTARRDEITMVIDGKLETFDLPPHMASAMIVMLANTLR